MPQEGNVDGEEPSPEPAPGPGYIPGETLLQAYARELAYLGSLKERNKMHCLKIASLCHAMIEELKQNAKPKRTFSDRIIATFFLVRVFPNIAAVASNPVDIKKVPPEFAYITFMLKSTFPYGWATFSRIESELKDITFGQFIAGVNEYLVHGAALRYQDGIWGRLFTSLQQEKAEEAPYHTKITFLSEFLEKVYPPNPLFNSKFVDATATVLSNVASSLWRGLRSSDGNTRKGEAALIAKAIEKLASVVGATSEQLDGRAEIPIPSNLYDTMKGVCKGKFLSGKPFMSFFESSTDPQEYLNGKDPRDIIADFVPFNWNGPVGHKCIAMALANLFKLGGAFKSDASPGPTHIRMSDSITYLYLFSYNGAFNVPSGQPKAQL